MIYDKTIAQRYEDLGNKIILQAMDDYKSARKVIDKGSGKSYDTYSVGKAKDEIRQIVQFFHSGFFDVLCRLDGDKLLQIAEEQYQREKR